MVPRNTLPFSLLPRVGQTLGFRKRLQRKQSVAIAMRMLHDWSGGATAIILRCNVTHLLVTSVKVLDFKHQAIFPTPLKMAAGGGLGTRLNIE